MTVKETLVFLIKNYPGLFGTREEALYHLFMILGNGFEWKNGQLVDESDDGNEDGLVKPDEEHIERLTQVQVEVNDLGYNRDLVDDYLDEIGRENDRRREIIDNAEEIATTRGSFEVIEILHGFYDSLPIANIPDDVDEDWLCSAFEVIDGIMNRSGWRDLDDNYKLDIMSVSESLEKRFGYEKYCDV